jgi:hypothetical protein
LTFTTGDGDRRRVDVFTGTSPTSTPPGGMTFAHRRNFNGAASVQISTDDQGKHRHAAARRATRTPSTSPSTR